MSLLKTRDYYKPFEYPWMYEYYKLQNQMHWMPESVPLHTDVKDWQELDSKEKMIGIINRVRKLNVERSVNSISDIVTDSSNVSSCYFTDPEGNEFELVFYQ